jgi:hypothetical protein
MRLLGVCIYNVLLREHKADCLQLTDFPILHSEALADKGDLTADQNYGEVILYCTRLSKT